jgi:glutathione synthase/RimK-type ligase-like ATP-grasp enzyme
MRLAFITTDRLLPYQQSATEPRFTHDDQLLAHELHRRGHRVQPLVWHTATREEIQRFDALLMRSPWDYMAHREAFFAFLDELEASGVLCRNPVPLLRSNLDKRYLLHLHQQGYCVPPTLVIEAPEPVPTLAYLMAQHQWPEIVIKPVVSGAAYNTFRITQEEAPAFQAQWQALVAAQPMLVQPFVRGVLAQGEWSVVYFRGAFSHAVLKRARPGDFRVQDDHGGTVHLEQLPDAVRTACDALAHTVAEAAYARLDGILDPTNGFQLMELELVEPELFFRADAASPARLCDALGW